MAVGVEELDELDVESIEPMSMMTVAYFDQFKKGK